MSDKERRRREREHRKARSQWRIQKQRERMIREAGGVLHCHICMQLIDLDLPARHPQSFELDHDEAVARDGTWRYENAAPSHRYCNQVKGTGTVAEARARLAGETVPRPKPEPPPENFDDLTPSPTTHGYWTGRGGAIYSKSDGKPQRQSREW